MTPTPDPLAQAHAHDGWQVLEALDSPGSGLSAEDRLTPRALFHLANRHVSATLGPRYPDTVLAHAGPMTLRNSCIVRWLDAGLPEGEVLARAGLRESQALLRLRKHVHASEATDFVGQET